MVRVVRLVEGVPMLWLVVTTLGAGLALAMLLLMLAAWQVAFAPVSISQTRAFALRRRAAQSALGLAENFAAAASMPAAGIDLARAVHRAAARLVRPCAPVPGAAPPPGGQGTLGITPPEALLIAAELQARYPQPDLDAMRERLRANLERLSHKAAEPRDESPLVCPLLRPDGYCATADSRPIVCLARNGGRCANCGVAELIEAQNVQAGISAGLHAAQLDGEVYELNSALLAALESRQPAADWLRGTPVFADCRRYVSRPAAQPA
jgi:hypothetical protein